MQITGTFSAAGQSSRTLVLRARESVNVILTKTAAYPFTVVLERLVTGAPVNLASFLDDTAGTTFLNDSDDTIYVRLRCVTLVGVDTIAFTLEDLAGETTGQPVRNAAGERVFATTDRGIEALRADIDGAANVGGALHVADKQTTALGVGTLEEVTGLTVEERGNGSFHETVLTLDNVEVEIVSSGAGAGVGGQLLYTLPQGRIAFLGASAIVDWGIAAAEQGNFTDGTPEGQVGLGTLAPANADALGTDATDDNLATAQDITGTDFAGDVALPSEAMQHLDGTVTPIPVVLNALIDAADIDNDATTKLRFTGVIRLFWANLGVA
jgi:hypothetical protein